MDLVYDNIIYSLQTAGGISTYWSELSKRLLRDNVNLLFVESDNNNIARNNVYIDKHQLISRNKYPLIIERFLTLKLSNIKHEFIFHSSYNRITDNPLASQVTTIHDFVHEKFYGSPRKNVHSYQKNKALYAARKIISVSENTKHDLLALHPHIDPEKIKVIYNGVSDDFFIIKDAKKQGRPYLLFIGSREFYKNFEFVINLIKELPDFDLYVVGRPFNKQEARLISALEKRIKIFVNICNAELNKLYNSAFALLYPSSYEGFGIPLLEAMRAGLPFVALNKSSIAEVAGKAGELIDQLDIDDVKHALEEIANNRKKYILEGLEQSANFSWERCYQETVGLYKELI
ncbi:glycosyltransferase family 1 protein [Mucilaginibacter sp. L3T2-6]|uniref:glycosyltransferase family 4 protein n=1 Tax=Mucilaginibacter sp. L3T2-6 TaxID=3062491 RepID=UPI002675883C|nr:glycosyltransferase family 1 protein [Mucilaginibacter sp. L3T2-6]MDO3642469.1 glycosyltransferase family 1 protein [Mucilaginibacter sp. L3T2-6]MDV6215135.1 glycosyltransferase family 1 protein [Mucilaginibacter sp. L3T2-6]